MLKYLFQFLTGIHLCNFGPWMPYKIQIGNETNYRTVILDGVKYQSWQERRCAYCGKIEQEQLDFITEEK